MLPRRQPWHLWLPALLIVLAILLPIVYLFVRATDMPLDRVQTIILRWHTLQVLLNTMWLTLSVLAVTTALGLPLAWLTTHTDIRGRRLLTWLCVMPLAVPGYLLAYTLLALAGPFGTSAQLTGYIAPQITGFWGALLALSLYNLPYMFLNLRTSFQKLNPGLAEAAQSLGHGRLAVIVHAILPQLRAGFLAGSMLVILHVVADFGVVSLMRYETYSYRLYLSFARGLREEAAWYAIILLLLTVAVLYLDLRFLGTLRLAPTGTSVVRKGRPYRLGWWKLPAYGAFALLALVGLGIPLLTIVYWVARHTETAGRSVWMDALIGSASASIPAALLATTMAVPIAYLASRYPSKASRLCERWVYLGYATPGLAFALGLAFFAREAMPMLYQGFALLVLAYALHFMAEAMGPIRSSLIVATPRLEEAGRSLGRGPWQTFMNVTFPLLRSGMIVSVTLVFLSAMKELPLTFILSPAGYRTLAKSLWDSTNEADFAGAAPYALSILIFCALFVGLLLVRGHDRR